MRKVKLTIILAIILGMVITAGAYAQTGTIRELSGTVELKPAGASAYAAAKAGDTVAMNTIVSTGFKSTALVSVGSTVITVRPLTRLSLAEISASSGSETLNVSLQTGRVRVDVNPPAGTRTVMSIQSPIATASVRGTSFEFDTQSLTVYDGSVDFSNAAGGSSTPVGAGGTSEILDNGKPADPAGTAAASLTPPPPAGSESGANQGTAPKTSGNSGTSFIFILK